MHRFFSQSKIFFSLQLAVFVINVKWMKTIITIHIQHIFLFSHYCIFTNVYLNPYLHCVISVSHGRRKINEFDYFRRSTVSNIHKIHRKSSCIFAHPIFFFLFLYFSQSFPLLIFALKTTIRCIVIISSNNNKNNKGGGT